MLVFSSLGDPPREGVESFGLDRREWPNALPDRRMRGA